MTLKGFFEYREGESFDQTNNNLHMPPAHLAGDQSIALNNASTSWKKRKRIILSESEDEEYIDNPFVGPNAGLDKPEMPENSKKTTTAKSSNKRRKPSDKSKSRERGASKNAKELAKPISPALRQIADLVRKKWSLEDIANHIDSTEELTKKQIHRALAFGIIHKTEIEYLNPGKGRAQGTGVTIEQVRLFLLERAKLITNPKPCTLQKLTDEFNDSKFHVESRNIKVGTFSRHIRVLNNKNSLTQDLLTYLKKCGRGTKWHK